jgi:two-component system C4-dicarboxylate transport response regulator DctD
VSRVLVIDDEAIVRHLIAEILEVAGYAVRTAESAERGLELLDDWQPNIVVSDIVMPGLSGLELLEAPRLRRDGLPVVLVTGAGTSGVLAEALAQGAAGLVTKPFSHAQLEAAVADALDRSHGSA